MFSFLLILLTSFITQHVTTTNDCSFDTEDFIDALPGRGANPKSRRCSEGRGAVQRGCVAGRPGGRCPSPGALRGRSPLPSCPGPPPGSPPGRARLPPRCPAENRGLAPGTGGPRTPRLQRRCGERGAGRGEPARGQGGVRRSRPPISFPAAKPKYREANRPRRPRQRLGRLAPAARPLRSAGKPGCPLAPVLLPLLLFFFFFSIR